MKNKSNDNKPEHFQNKKGNPVKQLLFKEDNKCNKIINPIGEKHKHRKLLKLIQPDSSKEAYNSSVSTNNNVCLVKEKLHKFNKSKQKSNLHTLIDNVHLDVTTSQNERIQNKCYLNKNNNKQTKYKIFSDSDKIMDKMCNKQKLRYSNQSGEVDYGDTKQNCNEDFNSNICNRSLTTKNMNKYDTNDYSNGNTNKKQKKKQLLNLTCEEYKPGMLSDILQKKKFGHLVLPWDPSFGLDPTKKSLESTDEGVVSNIKVKLNPLFDMSKRNFVNSAVSNTGCTIFVGNLPVETKVMDLKKLFKKCGLIVHAKLKRKSSKFTKEKTVKHNYNSNIKYINAKIRFKESKSCEVALKLNGTLYKGHHLRITLPENEGETDTTRSVFVGNLPFKTEDEDLWKALVHCGEIESVRVVRDEQSGRGKGFGYVNFKLASSIVNALKLNGMTLLDRNIRVKRVTKDAKSLSNNDIIKRKKKKKRQ